MVRRIAVCRRCGGEYLRGRGGYCDDPECQLDDVELACERSAQAYMDGRRTLPEHEEFIGRVLTEGLRPGERPSRRNSHVVYW